MTTDPFAMFDGAYVLGALSDEERRTFEAHLLECDECSASVRELGDLPGMLATVPESALTDEAPPLSLLPALQRRARRDIRRRRWIMSSVGAAAAACLIAVAVIVSRPSHSPAPVGNPVAMRPVTSAPIVATADVRTVRWGTKIDVVCRYFESDEATRPYALFVVAKSGERYQLGSWNLAAGKATKYEAGTSLDRSQIREIDVTTMSGMPLLTLPL